MKGDHEVRIVLGGPGRVQRWVGSRVGLWKLRAAMRTGNLSDLNRRRNMADSLERMADRAGK